MLKYRINTNVLATDFTELPIIKKEVSDFGQNDTLSAVTCYYEGDLDITLTSNVYITEFYEVEDGDPVSIQVSPEIIDVNREYRNFTFLLDKYYPLKISSLEAVAEDGVVKLKFIFETPHYFRSWDDEIGIYIVFQGTEGVLLEKYFNGCEIEDGNTLSWVYDSLSPDIDVFMCNVFNKDTYEFVGYEGNEDSVEVSQVPETACFTDEIYIKVPVTKGCDDKYAFYEKVCNEGDVSGLDCFRTQLMGDFTVIMETGDIRVALPLSQMHDTTLLSEDSIMYKYVEDEITASINKQVEMEKYVYHPVFIKKGTGFNTENITKIKFNLHFRQREGDDWKTEDNSFWNGVDNETLRLCGKVNAQYGKRFFTYNDFSKQSDLLCYLGFTNKDVKFQKNKLKKSFLRLMWYDSENPANQNLLFYSNVYMNGGALFSKYMNNVFTDGYVIPEIGTEKRYIGAKVNMDYAPSNFSAMKDDELEEHRLSSQISVSNIYRSNASSEGFNLYLWADNDTRNVPKDLYLKVSFNHAGYGRTIPLFMPYFDYEKEGKYGIKTFEEIMDDWRNNGGYGIRKFNKYSYIHFKCRYDKDNERRVYYLDPETYGDYAFYKTEGNNDSSPDELEINLYEGKVSFLNENDETV